MNSVNVSEDSKKKQTKYYILLLVIIYHKLLYFVQNKDYDRREEDLLTYKQDMPQVCAALNISEQFLRAS